MTQNLKHRDALKKAKRIVVKAGSKVLVENTGRPDEQQLNLFIEDISGLQLRGSEVAFVSSGAVGAGLEALGMTTRPKDISDLQMASAVGQVRLMSVYDKLFAENQCRIGQVLLTHDALKHRERHLNARNTLLNLISNGIIPVINENDAISTEEIKFGDNDVLAALVAILIDADALVILSTTDGLCDGDERVSFIKEVDEGILDLVSDKTDTLSTGGMASKWNSAQIAAHNGIPVVIADGRKVGALSRIFEGQDEGTLLFPKEGNISKRKGWIAFFNHSEGTLTVDDGAANALRNGKSLLAVGLTAVDGDFKIGAMVDIQSSTGQQIARGLVAFSSAQITDLINESTNGDVGEMIHRDNMLIF